MSKISNALKDLMSSVGPKEDPNAALPSEEAIPEEPLTLIPADQEKPVVMDPFSGLKPKKRANSMAEAPGEFEVSHPPEISVEFEQTELESSDTGPASETEKDHDKGDGCLDCQGKTRQTCGLVGERPGVRLEQTLR